MDSGVVVLDRDQRVVCWNYWFASASNISSEQAIGKTFPELFPKRSLGRLTTSIAEALDLGSSAFLTHSLNPNLLPLRTRAGLPLFTMYRFGRSERAYLIRIVCSRLSMSPAPPIANKSCVIDKMRATTLSSRVRSDIILTLDANGIVQFANPAAIRETRFERSELVGRALGISSKSLIYGKTSGSTILDGRRLGAIDRNW